MNAISRSFLSVEPIRAPGSFSLARRPPVRELLIFLAFLALTVLMTWPWVLHLRAAVSDTGDSYAHAYFLWWDYHQTFHNPLNLFHATIFYPYRYTLAFGENDYGAALFFFPLFALGFRPLTVYSIVAFLSFPFTGYGMFRLARTLSGSNGAGWIAGVALAFIPYRFHHLSHIPLLFAGWIPLLFEALVLFARERTWSRASWLGTAFLMNALTCITWFILTLIPLGLSAAILASRYSAWRDRGSWVRAVTALGAACLLLFPFLLPYYHVARAYGFVRSTAEVQMYSAHAANWLAVREGNIFWKRLGAPTDYDMALFPGAVLLALALAGIIFIILSVARNWMSRDQSSIDTFSSRPYSELFAHGVVWGAVGFLGSFGLNLFFHRALYEFVPLFRGMRAAVRWSMICYVGLALLAGMGASRLAELLNPQWPKTRKPVIFCILTLAMLFDQRVAPLNLAHGEVDADELALYLKTKKISGGIVELPAGESSPRYMLRAADHGHPLVTARNSFAPPVANEIESLTARNPVPDELLDLLERIPASYLTIHNSLISPERRLALEDFLSRGEKAGRLRFIKSFPGDPDSGLRESTDLYAVVKTEPLAHSEGPPPKHSYEVLAPLFQGLLRDFHESCFFVYRLYRASYGRAPHFAEFMADIHAMRYDPAKPEKLKDIQRSFVEIWANRPEFKSRYGGLNDQQFTNTLFRQAGLTREDDRDKLVSSLHNGTLTRAAVLQSIIDNDPFAAREFNEAFVLLHYFVYLQRDPDAAGYRFWLYKLNRSPDYRSFTEAFAASAERQLKPEQPGLVRNGER